MNRVIDIGTGEKEVEIRKTEKQAKRKGTDQYDAEDPFVQEDETVEVEELECKYENFFCLSGESLLPLEKKKEEKKEEYKIKKEKRESTRFKLLEDKEEALSKIKTISDAEIERYVQQLIVLEILTEQEPSVKSLVSSIKEKVEGESLEKIEKEVERLFTKENLQKIVDKTIEEVKELEDEIKEIIEEEKRNIDKSIPDDPTGLKYSRMNFEDSFIEKLCEYTEKEYTVSYIKSFLAGKKRVLEYGIKKNIFYHLQELFPPTYGANGSLGKKIASHFLKKKNKKFSQSAEKAESDSEKKTQDIPSSLPLGSTSTQGSLLEDGSFLEDPETQKDTFEEESFDIKYSPDNLEEKKETEQNNTADSTETPSQSLSDPQKREHSEEDLSEGNYYNTLSL